MSSFKANHNSNLPPMDVWKIQQKWGYSVWKRKTYVNQQQTGKGRNKLVCTLKQLKKIKVSLFEKQTFRSIKWEPSKKARI